MAKITPNQKFLHGEAAFEEGTEYDVPDHEAYFFAMSGWLASTDLDGIPEGVVGPKPEPTGEAVDLDVDKAEHGQTASDV